MVNRHALNRFDALRGDVAEVSLGRVLLGENRTSVTDEEVVVQLEYFFFLKHVVGLVVLGHDLIDFFEVYFLEKRTFHT